MSKITALLLILSLCIGFLPAQEVEYYEDNDSIEQTQEQQTNEIGATPQLNKYVVMLVSVVFIIVFYILLLSLYPKKLAKGLNPLTAAANQCMIFTLVTGIIIFLALLAISGFVFSCFWDTILNNIWYIALIFVIWLIYLVITISNKNKGGVQ